jgi:site-specific DNA-methyltransferase (cytosine-N4-specific)
VSANAHRGDKEYASNGGRNIRSVWTIATQPFPEAHFATFPEALVERCVKAGSRQGDPILDPFTGSGTTGKVALELGRDFIGCDLNPAYVEMARRRIASVAPLLAQEIP